MEGFHPKAAVNYACSNGIWIPNPQLHNCMSITDPDEECSMPDIPEDRYIIPDPNNDNRIRINCIEGNASKVYNCYDGTWTPNPENHICSAGLSEINSKNESMYNNPCSQGHQSIDVPRSIFRYNFFFLC